MVKQERVIAFICGISLAFVGSARAQRTVNDVQDYLGPRFHGTGQNTPSLNLPPHRPAPRIRFVIGIRSPLMPVDSITRRSRPEKLACSANSWARREASRAMR